MEGLDVIDNVGSPCTSVSGELFPDVIVSLTLRERVFETVFKTEFRLLL